MTEKKGKTPDEIVEGLNKVTEEMQDKNRKVTGIDKTMLTMKARAYELLVMQNRASQELQQVEQQLNQLNQEKMKLEGEDG